MLWLTLDLNLNQQYLINIRMQESGLLTKLKYSAEFQPKTQAKQQPPSNAAKTCKHDEGSLLASLKYGVKPQVNIFPIEVDFPLPTEFEGQAHRMNSQYNLEIPEHLQKRNRPSHLVGNVVRLDYLLSNASTFLDKDVTVAGWANSTRLQENNTLLFIELVDGTSPVPLQIVVKSTAPNFAELKKAKRSYSFRIFGRVIKSLGKGQEVELSISGEPGQYVKVLGTCDDDKYPLGGKYFTPEYLRDVAHLRPRTYLVSSVARVKNSLAYATHLFFQNNGFIYVHTPEITASDCEGAGEMFQVTTILPESGLISDIPQTNGKINYGEEFFKKPAFLTVSGQLAVENYCCALSNVYTFGPTFRAEVSHTSRHAAEFWMIEPEIAFADVYDVIECAEAYIKFCIKFVLENNAEDLKFLEGKPKKGLREYLESIISKPFAKASYTQAIDILSKVKAKGVVFENPCDWGDDLASEHQKYLCDHIFNGPTVLYNYPRDIKAFYMRQNPDGKTVASFDVLAPQIGEIVGGSQREERLETLEKRIVDLGLDLKSYWWYLELRKYGTVPHGGFGLGFERLIMMCTGVQNIRDVLAFPRTPGKAEF